MNDGQSEDENRKPNQNGNSEIRSSLPDIAATRLLARVGASAPSPSRYRIVVGGAGIVYDEQDLPGARRRFRLLEIHSQIPGTRYFGKSVVLFKKLRRHTGVSPARG